LFCIIPFKFVNVSCNFSDDSVKIAFAFIKRWSNHLATQNNLRTQKNYAYNKLLFYVDEVLSEVIVTWPSNTARGQSFVALMQYIFVIGWSWLHVFQFNTKVLNGLYINTKWWFVRYYYWIFHNPLVHKTFATRFKNIAYIHLPVLHHIYIYQVLSISSFGNDKEHQLANQFDD
jgi:hypothetical protein